MRAEAAFAALLLAFVAMQEPVVVDPDFEPSVPAPAYAAGQGPVVMLDAAHHNGDALDGERGAFYRLLIADGYRVRRGTTPFTQAALAGVDVVVIANARAAATDEESDGLGSAFAEAEIDALLRWIDGGGGLLLFVDHRPFPGAAADLGRRLGLELLDGYALDYEVWDPLVFQRADGTLASHVIADGRNPAERVNSVATFYGHAMRALSSDIQPLLVFGPGIESMQPTGLWEINDDTPRIDVEGWLQGAAEIIGRGRVVVFGEAGMAVAQRIGPNAAPRGMNAPVARGNVQLLLNAMHWLSGLLAER